MTLIALSNSRNLGGFSVSAGAGADAGASAAAKAAADAVKAYAGASAATHAAVAASYWSGGNPVIQTVAKPPVIKEKIPEIQIAPIVKQSCVQCHVDNAEDDKDGVVIIQTPFPVEIPYDVPAREYGKKCIGCDTKVGVPIAVHVDLHQCDHCDAVVVSTPSPTDKKISTKSTTSTSTAFKTNTVTTEDFIPRDYTPIISAPPTCDCPDDYSVYHNIEVEVPGGCRDLDCIETSSPCNVCPDNDDNNNDEPESNSDIVARIFGAIGKK